MRLHLAEDMDLLVVRGIFTASGIDIKATRPVAGKDGGVVLVGGENAFAVKLIRVPDHLEQRAILHGPVDFPGGIKNLVTAMLGVGLREHHQFDVVGIASHRDERLHQIIDFIVGQREAK